MKPQSVLDPGITVTMLRHMQSVQNFLGKDETANLSDRQILLTAEGREMGAITAEILNEYYASQNVTEVLVLVSPAKRTTDTCRLITKAKLERLDYKVMVLEDLKETCLVPEAMQASISQMFSDPGLFNRTLMESGDLPSKGLDAVMDGLVTKAQLQARLDRIPLQINKLAAQLGRPHVLLIGHQGTSRLLGGNQFLHVPLSQMDGFEKFNNDDVWKFDGFKLEVISPDARTLGTVAEGYTNPKNQYIRKPRTSQKKAADKPHFTAF